MSELVGVPEHKLGWRATPPSAAAHADPDHYPIAGVGEFLWAGDEVVEQLTEVTHPPAEAVQAAA
jgi:hypothetical protein